MSKQNRFSELVSIYSALSRNEKETVTAYVGAFQNKSHRDFTGIDSLLNLIDSNPEINAKEALKSLKIDKKPKLEQNSFLLRAKDVILECLTLSQNIERPGEYSNQFRNRSVNQKRIEQAKIFLSRGQRNIAEKLLQEVENRAEKYELFDQLLEAKLVLKLSYSTYRAVRTLKRYEADIDRVNELNGLLNQAKNIYSDVQFYLGRDELTDIQNRLDKLKELETKSRSATIGFLRAQSEVAILLKNKDYDDALKLMNALVEIRLYSPPLQSSKGVSELKAKIGYAQVLKGDFKGAGRSFKESDALVRNDTYESYKNRRNLILLDFYESNLQKLDVEIDKRISSLYTARIPYASAFYHFLKGINFIIKNQPLKAAEILSSEIEAIQDTSDREQFYRNCYLYIAGVDLQKSKVRIGKKYCNQAIDNLSKMSKTGLTQRENLIIRIFKQIRSVNYDLKKFAGINSQNLAKLEEPDSHYKWIPLSDEVIPIQNWIHHNLDKRKKLSKIK